MAQSADNPIAIKIIILGNIKLMYLKKRDPSNFYFYLCSYKILSIVSLVGDGAPYAGEYDFKENIVVKNCGKENSGHNNT